MGLALSRMTRAQRYERITELCYGADYVDLSTEVLQFSPGVPQGWWFAGGDGGGNAGHHRRFPLRQTDDDIARGRELTNLVGASCRVPEFRPIAWGARFQDRFYDLRRLRPYEVPASFRDAIAWVSDPIHRLERVLAAAAETEAGRAVLDTAFFGGLVRIPPTVVQMMTVTVHTLTNRNVRVDVPDSETTTVRDIMGGVEHREGIPQDQQRLIHGGSQLASARTLHSYGIQNGAVLHLVLRLRGGCCNLHLSSLLTPAPDSEGVPVTATVSVRLKCRPPSQEPCCCGGRTGIYDRSLLTEAENVVSVSVVQVRKTVVCHLFADDENGEAQPRVFRYDPDELMGAFLVERRRRLPADVRGLITTFLALDPSQWYAAVPGTRVQAIQNAVPGRAANQAANRTEPLDREAAGVFFEAAPDGPRTLR